MQQTHTRRTIGRLQNNSNQERHIIQSKAASGNGLIDSTRTSIPSFRRLKLKKSIHTMALVALTSLAFDAAAVDITFDNLAVGVTLSNQYAGVTFSANALSGAGYATNTDMKIVSATGTDVFELGAPNIVSGNVLHAFSGWLGENGDPSFRVTFANPVVLFSADFAGVDDAANVKLIAFDGTTMVGTVVGTSVNEQFHMGVTGAHITSVIVVPGTFSDYVAVDNLHYVTAVPELSTWAFSLLGLSLIGWARQRTHRGAARASAR